jgi:predicted DNA-binding transcriptional regulator YafY
VSTFGLIEWRQCVSDQLLPPLSLFSMQARKKPNTLATLAVALELIRRIPRHRKVTAQDLHEAVNSAGYERDERTIQRLLKNLCEQFDIERDDSSQPYGYRWGKNACAFSMNEMTPAESLVLMLAEQHLRALLPPKVMKAMDGFFQQARVNLAPHQDAELEKQWLKKVRVVSETQPLLPPKLARGVMEAVTEALYANQWLDVDYSNQQQERKVKKIMPLGLAQQGPRLYLVCRFDGYDNQRILAMHRINAATNTGHPFKRPNFNLESYDGEGNFAVSNGERIRLQFDIDKAAGLHLLESPLSADQNVQFTPTGYTITATVPQTLLLDRWLNSFGKQIRRVEKTPITNLVSG